MFIELLSQNEKNGLMELLITIAKADNEISHSEKEFLQSFALEHSIKLDFYQSRSLELICSEIINYQAKIVILQELVKLALEDGVYDVAEKEGILVISNLLGISSKKVSEIELWVIDATNVVKRGNLLLQE